MDDVQETVNKLNEAFMVDVDKQYEYSFEYVSNGLYEAVAFNGMCIWCSESANSEDWDDLAACIKNNLKEAVAPVFAVHED